MFEIKKGCCDVRLCWEFVFCRMSDCGNIDLNIIPSDNLLLDCSVQNSSMIGANAIATTAEGHVPATQTPWKKRYVQHALCIYNFSVNRILACTV